ncbi:MAG: M3 family oligoendopeptidase [Phycisphaeraceae bacterium]|nr:M3 family oligoendopeptidase [Phycisphaerales bacterium]QOJ16452.1 MAG: M3 family oligoendopeptidase [Phycisphaeraceae bacterium]
MTVATAASPFVPADLNAADWTAIEPLYRALLNRTLRCDGCLRQLLLDRSELDSAVSEAQANLYIQMTCHTDDENRRAAYLHFVEHVDPKVKQVSFELDRKIVSSPHVAKLDPAAYGVLLRDLKADVELFREENIPLQTEETKLDQQYDQICGAMTVTFRGEEKTLPQMGRFLEETDRATREEAWRGVAERRFADHERISGIFDRLVTLRHQMARNAGFENYRDYAFKRKHRFDYTPAHCEQFHQAAEECCVPLLRKLNAQRRRELSIDTLRPWDLSVDIKGRGPLKPFDGAADLIEKTAGLFHRMDGRLGELFDQLRGPGMLDLESRKGKAPGGYQYQRDRSRKPFIFMNAAGLQRDVETMVHEAGHAFHALLSQHQPLLAYRHAPLEFCEVASMSMELTAHPFLGEFYGSEGDAHRARRRHLEQLATLLPWIATIDAFQHWIYTHPGHSREDRTKQWLLLQERFGPADDWSGLEQYRAVGWQRQGHLFGAPFYYIEYGIAQLGALQLWSQYRRDPRTAIEHYTQALALGGSRPLPDLFNAAGLAFDFGPAMMKALMEEVQGELDRLPV